jgi:hypothetical protein
VSVTAHGTFDPAFNAPDIKERRVLIKLERPNNQTPNSTMTAHVSGTIMSLSLHNITYTVVFEFE